MIVGFVSQQTYYHFKAIHNGFVLTHSCVQSINHNKTRIPGKWYWKSLGFRFSLRIENGIFVKRVYVIKENP